MKTKKLFDPKLSNAEKAPLIASKPKSLRPMRSMVAVRSMKSKTSVAAAMMMKHEEVAEKR